MYAASPTGSPGPAGRLPIHIFIGVLTAPLIVMAIRGGQCGAWRRSEFRCALRVVVGAYDFLTRARLRSSVPRSSDA